LFDLMVAHGFVLTGTELAFIIGPPLAIGLSTNFFAEAGPLVAVLLLVIGVTAFLLQWQTEPKVVAGVRRNASSTLLIPGLRTIVLALLAMGVIGGSIDVAVVAFANAQDWPASASFILAAYALGSMIAGLTFGVLRVSMSIEKQFFVGVLVTAVTAVLPIFSPDVYILAAMLFVAGVSFAPTMVVVMNLGTIIIPASRITEGLTWMTTGISIGVALGGVLAGLVIDVYGARAGFGVAIVAGIVMVVIVLLGMPELRATSAVCAEPGFQSSAS
jgi:MFS family permease